ncbi:MAG: hypothetical protein ACYTG3_20680 [Planctomycetota bacterium]
MASRDKRRADIAKFVKNYRDLGAPPGTAGEQALWVILARHGSKEGATRALRALWRRYVDINEFRVAKATEIATVIQRNVKNDPYRVGEQLRGWLQRFHKDHHTVDFGITREMTVEQLRKYLANAESYVQEMALALFLYYCGHEVALEAEAAAAAEEEGKPRKRPEKDVTAAAERLRMLTATAAKGSVVAKTRQAIAARGFSRAWAFSPLPDAKRAQPKKGAAKKKPVRKTAKAAARGGGTPRPRTRATRTRRTAKKSSRR